MTSLNKCIQSTSAHERARARAALEQVRSNLAALAQVGCGPAYFRIGQTIYYRPEDVLAFEETAREHGGAG